MAIEFRPATKTELAEKATASMAHVHTVRSNAVRAARKVLGADAKQGTDFVINGEAGAYTWAPVAAAQPKAETKKTTAPADKPLAERRSATAKNIAATTPADAFYPSPEPAKKKAKATASSKKPLAERVAELKGATAAVTAATDDAASATAEAGKAVEGLAKALSKDTKQAKAVAMMRAKGGATTDALCEATGWLPHTLRAFVSRTVKEKLRLPVISTREGKTTTYRIPAADEEAGA